MAKRKGSSREDLEQKTKQCINFLIVICVLGIFVPLLLSIFFVDKSTHALTAIAIITAFVPPVFALLSYHNYHSATTVRMASGEKDRKEKNGDWLLYIGGVLSIVLITFYIGLSGGVNGHIMAYYFIFIPSATAVAFRTRAGLLIISAASIVCLFLLYYCCDSSPVERFDKWINMGFSVYQIGLIILLEYLTNKLPD